MKSLTLFALLLLAQRWTSQVSGKILDREGKPMAHAQVSYTQIGRVASTEEGARIIEGTGAIYKFKTDKKGEFTALGVQYGVYQIEIKDASGARVYSGKRIVGDNADPNVSNKLNVDLSTLAPPGAAPTDAEAKSPKSKNSKAQQDLIRKENSKAAQMNRLIAEAQTALEARDWKTSMADLQELIELDPNRWEFYQNLGTIQATQEQYQEAAQSFTKGIEVAAKVLDGAADPAKAKADVAGMMLYLGDAYNRLDKVDEAVAEYSKAATLSPDPATPLYRACSILANHGRAPAAIEACNKAIAADPRQWLPYQTLAGVLNNAGKSQDALEAYEKGVQAAKKILELKPDSARDKNGMGQLLNAEGNIYAQLKQYDRAEAAFTQSAEVSAYAALPYFNLCATYYNISRMDDAVGACNKAIASDPTMVEAYYIKASALFGKGRLEKGKYAAPPETRDVLNQYLARSPYGQHATAVRDMLEKLDEEIETTDKPTPTPKPKPKATKK